MKRNSAYLPLDAVGLLTIFGYFTAAVVAASSLTWKMGNDQAVFTVIAEMIIDGGIPYRDAWDLKGPLTFYVYAFALWTLDRPGLSIRIFDLFALAACCVVLHRLVSVTVDDRRVARVTPVIFLLVYFSLGYWNTAQPDGWAAMIFAGVTLLLISPPQRTLSMAAAGLLIAAAASFKPTFAIYLVLPVLFPCMDIEEKRFPFRDVAVCIAVFGVAVAVPTLLLVRASGGAEDLLDTAYFLQSHASLRINWAILKVPFFRAYVIPAILWIAGIIILYRSSRRRLALLMAVWGVLGLAMTVLQGKYFPYHLIPFLVAAILPIAVATHAVASLNRDHVLMLLLLVIGVPMAFYSLHGRDSSAAYERPQAAVAAYVVANSSPKENILVWAGELNPVYTLSDRRPPTRFSFSYPLIQDSRVKLKYQKIFMRDIAERPPYYVIFDSREEGSLRLFPEFNEFLCENYTKVAWMDENEIWRLKRADSGGVQTESSGRRETIAWGPWSR